LPDHYHQLSLLIDMSVSQLGPLVRLHDRADFHPALVDHCAPPLLFRRQPPQLNCPASNVRVVVEILESEMDVTTRELGAY